MGSIGNPSRADTILVIGTNRRSDTPERLCGSCLHQRLDTSDALRDVICDVYGGHLSEEDKLSEPEDRSEDPVKRKMLRTGACKRREISYEQYQQVLHPEERDVNQMPLATMPRAPSPTASAPALSAEDTERMKMIYHLLHHVKESEWTPYMQRMLKEGIALAGKLSGEE